MKSEGNIEARVSAIEERNRRVELDKAWETSWTRRIIVAVLTYVTFVLFFYAADLKRPFLDSLIPTIAFILSTASLPFFKKLWLRFQKKE